MAGLMKAGNFKGQDLVDVLSFYPDELGKVALITDRGCTRVFEMSHINLTERLSKTTVIVPSFQKEPHRVVYAGKVLDKPSPFSYDAVFDDATRVDVSFPDFYLTPTEKYAKRPDGFPVKNRILHVSFEESTRITEEVKALPLPVKVLPPSPLLETPDEVTKKDGYEQISLFDEEDESSLNPAEAKTPTNPKASDANEAPASSTSAPNSVNGDEKK